MSDATESVNGSLDPQDEKLITLARAARARNGTATAGAVRDQTGRTYVGTDIALPSLTLSGLQLAVAQAVAGGADRLAAAAVVATDPGAVDTTVTGLVAEVGADGMAPVFLADSTGALVAVWRP